MSKRFFVLAALALALCAWAAPPEKADKLDLNAANLEQIRTLPLTIEQADAIWQRLQFEGPFHNVYELMELPEIDAKTLAAIRDLVRVNPPRPSEERIQRMEDAYYRIENLGTEEGTNVGLVDEWIDRLMEPLNVNTASLDELMDLQNVSPADAVAIYTQVQKQGGIRGSRDLRAVPGLSDWGYRNARNYLGYDELSSNARGKLHGTYTFRAYNTPFFSSDELAVKPTVLIDPRPDVSHKLRFTYDRNYKAGVLWHRNMGEETVYQTSGKFRIPEFKWFAGAEKQKFGPVLIDRIYLGDYQVSFGQGLAMESGDYFSPRYTGFGFDKRITGIAPDLSRSREFSMHGGAFESYVGPLKATGFVSAQKKDAILNPDGSMNRLIALNPRSDEDIYPSFQKIENKDTVYVPGLEGRQSMLNAVTEVGFGGELAYRPWVGTSVGMTATQFMYSLPMSPDFGQGYQMAARTDTGSAGRDTMVTIYPVIDPTDVRKIFEAETNSEALEGYRSSQTSKVWSGARSVRRIMGLNWMSVVNNYTFQAEFAQLEKTHSFAKVGADPHAFVASAYGQWNSLSLLALFRNYSIGYDNPYCRGYSNYARYKGTTYEDEYYLINQEFAQLQRNAAVPQAEQGIYLESRYQISRPLTVDAQVDNWRRVADNADYYRWVGNVQYRPVWPVVVRIRQKLQGRSAHEPASPTGFQTYENRLGLEFRLSRYDNLQLLYATGYTRFTPRPRLGGESEATGQFPIDAQGASPTEAIGAQLTHYLTPRIRVRAAWLMYDGFFWNFEDSDFAVVNGKSARWWFSVSDRLTDHVSVRFKLTGDSSKPYTWNQSRSSNAYPTTVPGYEYSAWDNSQTGLSFRIQMDYLF